MSTKGSGILQLAARSYGASIGYPLLVLLVFLAGWQVASRTGLVPPYILPAPTDIGLRLGTTFPLLVHHAAITSVEIALGFLLAVAGGVLFATLITFFRVVEQSVYPWLVVVQVIPKVALGPLLVLWLGFGLMPKVLMSFLLAFFPVMINAIIGLRSVPRDSTLLLRSMGASWFKVFYFLQLPTALPSIFGSMKVAVTLATVGAIVGEFIGSNTGLGYVLISANGVLDTTLMFVALTWIVAVSLVFYGAVVWLERYAVSWHVSVRNSQPYAPV